VVATNAVGNSVASSASTAVTPVVPVCPASTVTDIQNNPYNTVAIGTQCWMAENLRTRLYNDNTEIRFDNSGGGGGTTVQTWAGTGRNYGAYTIYANDSTATPSNLTSYGYLYNWYAVAGIITDGGSPDPTKNICPSGWHVPKDADWTILTNFLGGDYFAGGKMKSTGTTYWSSESAGTNNSSGFSALPGGFRYGYNGSFSSIRFNAYFWSATESGSPGSADAWYCSLSNSSGSVSRGTNNKAVGASVRCLKDSL
jgi:uncharacterized protein (TIGR02145 family)